MMKKHIKTYTRGFTLIELLTVIAVIGILAGVLVPVGSKVQQMARISSAISDIKTNQAIVAEASSRLGGTLPLTEAGTGTIPVETGAAPAATDFYNFARLEHVLVSLQPPLMETYFRPKLGSQAFARADGDSGGELAFNTRTQKWRNVDGGAIVATGKSYDSVSRLECRPVDTSATPGTGANFRLNGGTSGLPAGRVAYIVFKDVPAGEAYQLARGINGDALLTDTSEEGTNDQINGQVTYLGSDTGVVDVYVYLAAF